MPAATSALRSLCASALLVAPVASAAGGATAQPQQAFTDSLSVEQVLVPVVVRSGNRFVGNLSAADFELFVDDHRTRIASFDRSRGAPVHTLVLQDLSGSMGGSLKLAWSRALFHHLMASGKPGDLYTLGTFAASGVVVEPEPTADRAAIKSWAARWKPFGRTGIHDAVARIPELISADSAWRGAVLLVTDGIDNASRISARQARAIARRAELPVHVIALIGHQAPDPEQDWSSDPLHLLSWVTGGQFHAIETAADLKSASEAFLRELRSQYILAFSTSGTGPVRPREIRVEVRGKRRKVSHRREYLGTPPGAAR